MEQSFTARIAAGRTDLVFEHLARGGKPGDTDAGGVSLIEWCAYYGDVSAIRFLVSQGASLDALGPNRGLNGAAFHGHWRLCRYLIENGADVNLPLTATGETPLHSALCTTERGRHDLVLQVLLRAGADPNRATIPGAATDGFMRDVRTRGETPLHRAAAFGTDATIRMLLDAGASREARDAHGDSPLSWASWHLRPDAILRLLLFGDFSIHPQRRQMEDSLRGEILE